MKMVFADSFYFFALLSPRDAAHRKCCEFSDSYTPSLLTTAWVITEVADGFSTTPNRSLVAKIVDRLLEEPGNVLLPPSESLFERGLQLYHDRPDKDWSLTDCISFVAMQDHGVTEALTGDRHFEQAGFVALLADK
jgi:predicted nucleic acid-binding protein